MKWAFFAKQKTLKINWKIQREKLNSHLKKKMSSFKLWEIFKLCCVSCNRTRNNTVCWGFGHLHPSGPVLSFWILVRCGHRDCISFFPNPHSSLCDQNSTQQPFEYEPADDKISPCLFWLCFHYWGNFSQLIKWSRLGVILSCASPIPLSSDSHHAG